MNADPSEPMRHARRLDSAHKHKLVLATLDATLEQRRPPTIAGIARAAGVGRKFIYDHPDLKAAIELNAARTTDHQANDMIAAARVTGASLRADLENLRAHNHRLTKQVRALENRLSQTEGARLVADHLLPDDTLAELADQQLAQRNAELDQQLFEAREQLRRTVEELDAARAINRELMQHANRPSDHSSGRTHPKRPTTNPPPVPNRPEP